MQIFELFNLEITISLKFVIEKMYNESVRNFILKTFTWAIYFLRRPQFHLNTLNHTASTISQTYIYWLRYRREIDCG